MRARRVLVGVTCALAIMVFAVVQDRVTAAGARRYAATSRQALESGRQSVAVGDVMGPAIRSSVRWGAASAGLVLVVGLGVVWLTRLKAGQT